MKKSINKSMVQVQKEVTTDEQGSQTNINPKPQHQKSGRQCIVILAIFCSIIILLGCFLTYSICTSMQKMNQKLQNIELKFHKFLFYLKYIYKTQKQKESIDAEQNNSIMDLFTKLTTQNQMDVSHNLQNSFTKIETQRDRKESSSRNTVKNEQKATEEDDELFSQDQIVDIAKKIIKEQQSNNQPKHTKPIRVQPKKNIQSPSIPQKLQPTMPNVTQLSQVSPFDCHIDPQNTFYPNFLFDPQTQKLRKSIFTSRFQAIICDEPIPQQGIWQLALKVIQTSKSFIYIGIAGGNQTLVYNITSLHENKNFFGYSGFSGRIWERTKRKAGYEMLQKNTVFKLQVDMNLKTLDYFYNDVKIGSSILGDLCQEQCMFVIQMYSDGDQIQILNPQEVNEPNATVVQQDLASSDL